MSSLSKMTLVAYSDEKFSSKVSEYEVLLNPESIKWDRSIEYNNEQAQDSNALSSKYKATAGEKISFDLVIDCSGVVDSKRVDLPKEMKNLAAVVYDYNGSIHRPNFVAINWGDGLAFKGVLTSIDTNYTYFKPDGTAIRAKVSLSFTSYVDPVTAARKADKKSPDMTHLITVVEGDSLAKYSEDIYSNPDYYIQIAQFNGLNKFRHLPAGSQISVPPLVSESKEAS